MTQQAATAVRQANSREVLEALREQLAGIDTLCVAMGPLLRQLSRIDDKETAVAIGHVWRLIEFLGREVKSSIEFADCAIAALLKDESPTIAPPGANGNGDTASASKQ